MTGFVVQSDAKVGAKKHGTQSTNNGTLPREFG